MEVKNITDRLGLLIVSTQTKPLTSRSYRIAGEDEVCMHSQGTEGQTRPVDSNGVFDTRMSNRVRDRLEARADCSSSLDIRRRMDKAGP
jgi:hypothetical protein